jgi:DNA-binding NtrC family response regulator
MMEKRRILVVDDEENSRNVLSQYIIGWGHNVITAKSGEEALDTMAESSFDIVITDLRMTGISGIDLLREIKKNNPDTGALIITAFGEMDSYIEAMNLGAFDYLIKPIKLDELKKVISSFFIKEECKKQK